MTVDFQSKGSKMIIDFINENIKQKDYSVDLANIDTSEFTEDEIKLVNEYRTPNRGYIKSSARAIGSDVVTYKTLAYIAETCHECSIAERYEAMVVTLYKFHEENSKPIRTKELQAKLVSALKQDVNTGNENLGWVDEYSTGKNNIFYLLEITIGVNKMFKFGITSNRLRQRIATLKNDIKTNYDKQAIIIKPLLIIECDEKELFENEAKILISEHNLKGVNYNFKGHTELISYTSKDLVYEKIILPIQNQMSCKLLYDSRSVAVDKDVVLEEGDF